MSTTTPVPAVSACMEDRHMWYYILSSVTTLALAVILVLVPRLLHSWYKKLKKQQTASTSGLSSEDKVLLEPSVYTNVQNWAGDLISGNTATGRFLVVFAFCCSIAAMVIYIYGKICTL